MDTAARLADAGEPPSWLLGVIVRVMDQKLQMTIEYDDADEDGWIVARVVEVPGAISQGRSREEARENVIDALQLMLAPHDDNANVAAGRGEHLDLTLSLSE